MSDWKDNLKKENDKTVDVKEFFDDADDMTVTVRKYSTYARNFLSTILLEDVKLNAGNPEASDFDVDVSRMAEVEFFETAFGLRDVSFLPKWQELSTDAKVQALREIDEMAPTLYKRIRDAVKEYNADEPIQG